MPQSTYRPWPFNATAAARFWAKVDRRGPDECWGWTASLIKGYGQFMATGLPKKTVVRASRAAWAFEYGAMPPPHLHVCHTCDNPLCVNVAHLFLGTDADNVADAQRKGHYAQRLTTGAVHAIRRDAGRTSQRVLAKRYGVGHQAIGKVLRRETWNHV